MAVSAHYISNGKYIYDAAKQRSFTRLFRTCLSIRRVQTTCFPMQQFLTVCRRSDVPNIVIFIVFRDSFMHLLELSTIYEVFFIYRVSFNQRCNFKFNRSSHFSQSYVTVVSGDRIQWLLYILVLLDSTGSIGLFDSFCIEVTQVLSAYFVDVFYLIMRICSFYARQ